MAKRKFIPILLIILSVFLFQAVSAYAISWSSNLEAALKNAKSKQKPVMADFYTDWCGWCEKLDKETYADRKVSNLAREFISVKVNGDKARDAVRKYGIRGYPTVLFFDSNGKVVQRIGGYVGPVDFAKIMKGVLKGTKLASVKKSAQGKKGVLPLEERPKPSVTEKENGQKADFKLSGIAYHPGKPKAIINDTVVKVGDKIDGAEVVEISKKSVKLYHEKHEIVLEMK